MIEKLTPAYIDFVKGKRKGALSALFYFLLLLPSLIYCFLVKLIYSCYQTGLCKSAKVNSTVISVGNLTWGGTGKTPLVAGLAEFLKQKGKKPAVLIRGYGKDEVYMLKDRLKDIPVLAGKNRLKTAKIAFRQYGADTLILDDGFQYWPLQRDVNIVLVDATLPFGNKMLIPLGMLREPLSALSRADIFLLTKTDLAKQNIEALKQQLRRYNGWAPIYEAVHQPAFLRQITSDKKIEPDAIRGRRLALVSAIANPESFTETLNSLGAKAALKFYFPDHYEYNKADLENIERLCLEEGIDTLVSTEKDAAKLAALLSTVTSKLKFWVLGVEIKIVNNGMEFFEHILRGRSSPEEYSILVLSDGKAGHLNQSQAVAGIIQQRKIDQGVSGDTLKLKTVRPEFKNRFYQGLLAFCALFARPACGRCLNCLRYCLRGESFNELMGLRADIIVSAGASLSSVNLFLGYKNKARKVNLMKPHFFSLNRFDLVIAPEHDRIKTKDNVVSTRIAPNLINQQYLEQQASALKSRLTKQALTIGALIGGDTAKFSLSAELAHQVAAQLKKAAVDLDGRILLTSSRRTSSMAEAALKQALKEFPKCNLLIIANEENIPQAVGGILGLSDIIIVSGESISMVSEAVSSGKYVLVFWPGKKVKGLTKQERFVESLAQEQMLDIVRPEGLSQRIQQIWQRRPPRREIKDNELIYRALGKIL